MAKYLEVRFPDGYWRIPAHIIADDRAKFYAKGEEDEERAYAQEYAHTMESDFMLCDWTVDNMNWSDVKVHAVHVRPLAIDYENEWLSCEKEVVEVE